MFAGYIKEDRHMVKSIPFTFAFDLLIMQRLKKDTALLMF